MVISILLVVLLLSLAKCDSRSITKSFRQETDVISGLSKIDEAMVAFVMQNRRLPCPADGRIASTAANAGLEDAAACNTQRYGVVPWAALGLNERDARDSWNTRFSYRVDPALAAAAPRLMNMSNCDVSGTASVGAGGICQTPTPTCIANPATCTPPATFLAGKGLDVWNGVGGAAGWAARTNNRPAGSGAAYVVISHGKTGAGGYNSSGIYQPGTIGPIAIIPVPPFPASPTQLAGDDELPNLNNKVLTLPATLASTYRDAAYNTSRLQSNFDDFISHPSISTVLSNANLNERVH